MESGIHIIHFERTQQEDMSKDCEKQSRRREFHIMILIIVADIVSVSVVHVYCKCHLDPASLVW